jgi:hypothetical protein
VEDHAAGDLGRFGSPKVGNLAVVSFDNVALLSGSTSDPVDDHPPVTDLTFRNSIGHNVSRSI